MHRLQNLGLAGALSVLLTLTPLAKAHAIVWFGIPWLVAWLLKAKVVAVLVTVATIASGVHAMIEVAERAGYKPMPDSAIEDNVQRLQKEYRRVHEEARASHPLRYCSGARDARLLVHDGVTACPGDGSVPKVEDHYVFARNGDTLKVEVRRPSHP